ncbi:MAG: DUF4143 domain-containing protein [Bacteroidota bacterium]
MLYIREKYHEQIKNAISNVPITVLIGARQCGKTSLMKSLSPGMDSYDIDGQTPEATNIFADLNDVEELLKIKLNSELEGLFIIDEFQYLNKISSKLKILSDKYPKLKILCSGSSSLDIIQTVEESLAGRVRVINVNSLSFSESLLFEEPEAYLDYQKYTKNTNDSIVSQEIKSQLKHYLVYGGMPRMARKKGFREKIRTLDDIYKTYLMRDVRSFVRNEDSVGFNKLLQILALQIGNLVNVNELSRTTGLSYNKCEEYIYLLEQMFIIKMIPPFASNKKKAIKKMKKVYFLDLGLRNIIINNFNNIDSRNDSGALFENFVFLEIIKSIESYSDLSFYRTRDGAEVDFVINDMYKLLTFEAKYKNISKPIFLKALKGFNKDENVKESFVINLNLNQKNDNQNYIQAYLLEKVI